MMQRFRKPLSILLTIIMIVSMFTIIPVSAAKSLDLEGSGTESAPYLIKTAEDWNAFTAHYADGLAGSGEYFELKDDITVSTAVSSNPFTGIFDGGGHTLTLNNLSTSPFGNISGAVIRNLTVAGTVSGGMHVSALVGSPSGTAENLIENVVVTAEITTSEGYCGGFIGHAGSTATTKLKNCIFDGTMSGETLAGTFVGWGDKGCKPVLENCLDVSASVSPIGRSEWTSDPVVINTYYTCTLKINANNRTWDNRGKLAYAVTGDEVDLTLNGTPGVAYDGKIYAAPGETLSLTASSEDVQYMATAGNLSQDHSALILVMPGRDTVIMKSGTYYKDYCDVHSEVGFEDEGAENLFDGDTGTKWCGYTDEATPCVIFRTQKEVVVKGYLLATADDTSDNPERNPISWTLEGSANGLDWTELTAETRNTALGSVNEAYYSFALTNPTDKGYSFFRFTIKKVSRRTTFQISELRLLTEDDGSEIIGEDILYGLWLGSVQVNLKNKDDILNDGGKAKFDPLTRTLTLDEPAIEDAHIGRYNTHKIFAEFDLTVKGSFHMDTADVTDGIYSSASLILDGDFTFMGQHNGIRAYNAIVLRGGTVTGIGNENSGIYSTGSIDIENGVKRATATGGKENFDSKSINLGNRLFVRVPYGGVVSGDPNQPNSPYQSVYEADGAMPETAVIEPYVEYDLWVGSKQVNARNRDDILGDGSATFDPDTNTLTLYDPVITGSHENKKIHAKFPLTVKGSYHMNPDQIDVDYAVALTGSGDMCMTLAGDLTLCGNVNATYGAAPLVIESGNLKFYGKDREGLYARGALYIENDVTRLEVWTDGTFDQSLFTSWLWIGEAMLITLPENGVQQYNNIYYPDRSTKAKHFILERGMLITFDAKGLGGANPASQTLRDGEKVTKPADLTEEGYNFLGWFTDEDCTQPYDFSADVTGDLNLYAKWEKITYTVDFDMNGHGTAPETQYIPFKETITEPDDPETPGYIFEGWFADKGCTQDFDFTVEVTQDMTVYAKWLALEYSILIVADNGTPAKYTETDKYHYGDEYVLPFCIFAAPEEKRFDCWDKGAAGETITITGNTTLTARWRNIYRLGDVDGDGKVDIFDASAIQKSIAGMSGYVSYNTMDKSDPRFMVADVDGDGKVDIFDASLIQKYIAGDAAAKAYGIAKPIED